MHTGSIGSFSNREDWIITCSIVDESGAGVSLTSAEIEFYVTKPDTQDASEISATTSNGRITLTSDTSFKIVFDKSDVAGLRAETYGAFMRITIGEETTQLFSGEISVVHGGPQ